MVIEPLKTETVIESRAIMANAEDVMKNLDKANVVVSNWHQGVMSVNQLMDVAKGKGYDMISIEKRVTTISTYEVI